MQNFTSVSFDDLNSRQFFGNLDNIPPRGYIGLMNSTKSKKTAKSPSKNCCEKHTESAHPDHSEFLPRLNRIEGQISGIQKMIQDGRYCVDILVQFRAAMAALRSVEVSIFEKHLYHCLSSSLLSKDKKQVDEKIQELTELLSRRSSL